ncbi:MAG: site-specific integrase [Clostridiales bacterium]|nr:site-specific integrase [Clostridiales bacterium]
MKMSQGKNERITFKLNGKQYEVEARKNETHDELVARAALKRKEIEDGAMTVNQGTQFGAYAKKYLETYKRNDVGEAMYALYESNLRNHILPYIGHLKIKDIKPINCKEIINARAGHSKSHISKIVQLLNQVFEAAMDDDIIIKNPARNLQLPAKAKDGTGRAITDHEREYSLKVAETHKAGVWVKTMLYTGMRPGETAALQFRHIDFKARTITVEQARESKTDNIAGPKSMAGKRVLPIREILLPDLFSHCEGKNGDPWGYVFTQETTGNRHTKTSMYHLWCSFKRELNIAMGCRVYRSQLIPPFPVAEDLIAYCFRHTFASDMAAAGVPVAAMKMLMGHEDVSTTMRYTHKTDELFENARGLLDKFSRPGKQMGKNEEGKFNMFIQN